MIHLATRESIPSTLLVSLSFLKWSSGATLSTYLLAGIGDRSAVGYADHVAVATSK